MKQHASPKLYVYSLGYVFALPCKLNDIGEFFSVIVGEKKGKELIFIPSTHKYML